MEIKRKGWVIYVKKGEKKEHKGLAGMLLTAGRKAYEYEEKKHKEFMEAVEEVSKTQKRAREKIIAENLKKQREKARLKNIIE